jgi:hypothetical protein
MKRVTLILSIFLSTFIVQAQGEDQVFNSIANIFTQNNYQEFSKYFANTLDMTLEDEDGTYGKQQALVLIKDFFESHETKSFRVKHIGSSNERTNYAVCELKSNSKTYSVYILLNKQSEIIQLQIEE